jgi:hypothetical protein
MKSSFSTILKLLLVVCVCVCVTNFASACKVAITGPKFFCEVPSSIQVYEVELTFPAGAAIGIIEVTGGSFTNYQVTSASPLHCLWDETSWTTATRIGIATLCNKIIVQVSIAWSSTASTHLIYAETGCNSNSLELVINDMSGAYVDGPNGQVCQSTSSLYFISAGTSGATSYQWTYSSTGGPLSFSCPTCHYSTVSGFQPGNLYSINFNIYCGGALVRTISHTIITSLGCLRGQTDIVNIPHQHGKIAVAGSLSKPFLRSSGEDLSHWQDMSDIVARRAVIFPNPLPLGTSLQLNPPNETDVFHFRIFDNAGKLLDYLRLSGQRSLVFPSTKYAAGSYLVQLSGEGWSQRERLIIVR